MTRGKTQLLEAEPEPPAPTQADPSGTRTDVASSPDAHVSPQAPVPPQQPSYPQAPAPAAYGAPPPAAYGASPPAAYGAPPPAAYGASPAPPPPAPSDGDGSSKALWIVGGGVAAAALVLGVLAVAVIAFAVLIVVMSAPSKPPAPVATATPTSTPTLRPAAPVPTHVAAPACDNCSWSGTKCQDGACVLDPHASWTLRATSLYADPSATLGASVRVCTRRTGERQFWCSPLRAPVHPATVFPKAQNVALAVTTPDLVSTRGIDIQIQQDGRAWCTQYNTSHSSGLRPGELLFDGGVAYSLPACRGAFSRVVFKLDYDPGGGD